MGKNVEQLRQRVQELENQIEDLVEFDLAGGTCTDVGAVTVETGEPGAAPASVLSLSFGQSECHAMHHQGSRLKVWANGSWESSCTLHDRSKHSKWSNSVYFYLGKHEGDVRVMIGLLGELAAWSGNLGPGEVKTYPAQGSLSALKASFSDLAQGKLRAFRHWSCRRR